MVSPPAGIDTKSGHKSSALRFWGSTDSGPEVDDGLGLIGAADKSRSNRTFELN